jgi:hypothetical protein
MSWGPRTLQRWMMLKSRIDFQSHEIHSSHNGTDFISMFECFYKSIYHHLYILIYSSWVLGLHSLWFYCMVVWNAVNKSKSIHQTMNMIWPWLHWSWTVTVAQSGFGCVGYIYMLTTMFPIALDVHNNSLVHIHPIGTNSCPNSQKLYPLYGWMLFISIKKQTKHLESF